ncbi:MAG: NUDIX domain-containing protein [Flavobacteriaceae bacterium]|nr:NUDIX domain-containing protein [Flavobacteriaceae bacterium]
MYKVFANEHPIILTNILEEEGEHRTFLLETAPLVDIFKNMGKSGYKRVHLYHKDADRLLPLLFERIKVVLAAGGVVKNKEGQILFIFRKGKWDIPKGKVDKKESLEDAAIREVEEETGVSGLSIDSFLMKTYHIFKRRNMYQLKETYWYAMRTSYTGKLVPQVEEEITEVAWKSKAEIKGIRSNTYENIKLLLP